MREKSASTALERSLSYIARSTLCGSRSDKRHCRTLDGADVNYTVERLNELSEKKEKLSWSLPKRVLAAFTEGAINRILSKDEIPNESGILILDGESYTITITKGDIRKEYYADAVNIETYPLLRYLASWYRGHRPAEW